MAIILLVYGFNSDINAGLRWIDIVIAIAILIWVFLAGLGQRIRRLHDVNYSGYWYWAGFTGYGGYFLFYLALLQPSVQRPVKWGNYLFNTPNNAAYYNQKYDPQMDHDDTPVPKITQIIKEHFFDCFKWNYRSTRTSYWVGTAINSVIAGLGYLFFYLIVFFTGLKIMMPVPNTLFSLLIILAVPFSIVFIWAIIAQIGHAVRRLHDAGLSGGWWWIGLVPYVGNLLLAFLLFHPTTKQENKWNDYLLMILKKYKKKCLVQINLYQAFFLI